ncbi:MAG: hypothetical protein ACE5H9_00770 [Anaerolineae bacterium]
MDDGFLQPRKGPPALSGGCPQAARRLWLAKVHWLGCRITVISLAFALLVSLTALRPVGLTWQLLIERLLIYLAPVLTLIIAYFLGRRVDQAGDE